MKLNKTLLAAALITPLAISGCSGKYSKTWTGHCMENDQTDYFCGVEFETRAECNATRIRHDREMSRTMNRKGRFPGTCY